MVSQSDIVVLGELSGSAFAGMSGNTNATITALSFLPEQYNIAGVYGSPMEKAKNSTFSSVIRPHRRKWLSSVTVLLI